MIGWMLQHANATGQQHAPAKAGAAAASADSAAAGEAGGAAKM